MADIAADFATAPETVAAEPAVPDKAVPRAPVADPRPAAVPRFPTRVIRPAAPAREPLWRHALGEQFRALRHQRGETLAETAARAGVSPQYLSEVERGIKEPSSEMIAAVGGALGVGLVDLTLAVADRVRRTYPTAQANAAVGRAAFALAV
jgi:DNA-binding XRE family transcriptional regulator